MYVAYKYVNANNQLNELPTPIRSGYTFAGWYTDPTNGEKITSTSTINSDTTVYARYFEQFNQYLKAAYVYNESGVNECQTGNEDTCLIATCVVDSSTCPAGTIVDYQVNNSTTNNT